MSRDTRTLTEGAVLAALTVLIATLYLYLPLPLLVAVPLPLLILTYRHGMQAAIPVAFVAALLAGLISHFVQGVILVLAMGALGLTLGEGLRQKFQPVSIVLMGTVIMLIVSVAPFNLTFWIIGINSLEMLAQSFTQSLTQVQSFYQRMGVDPAAIPITPEEYGDLIRMIFPATLLMSSAVLSCLTYWLGGLVLGKLGSSVPPFPRFRDWVFPKWLGFGTLILLLARSVLDQYLPPAVPIATNFFLIGTFLLVIEGLALTWSLITRLAVGKGVKVLLLILVFFMAAPLLIWVGFADNFADFRNLRRISDEGHFKG